MKLTSKLCSQNKSPLPPVIPHGVRYEKLINFAHQMDGCSVIGLGRHVLKPAILVTQISEVPERVRILISRPDFEPKQMELLDLHVMLITIW